MTHMFIYTYKTECKGAKKSFIIFYLCKVTLDFKTFHTYLSMIWSCLEFFLLQCINALNAVQYLMCRTYMCHLQVKYVNVCSE